jgi:hypothetical protein
VTIQPNQREPAFFFVAKIRQNAKKRARKSHLGKKWIKKKSSPYFDLSKAHDATHAMHGVDPSLLVLQDAHSSSPHFLKQRLVVAISRLPLLDVANFIMA